MKNWKVEDLPERWRKKIQVVGNGCWLWRGATGGIGVHQYGQIKVRLAFKRYILKCAHAAIYEYLNGTIPEGLECDHKCEQKLCCNPAHIDIVTHKVNCERRAESAALYRNLEGYISSTRALSVSV